MHVQLLLRIVEWLSHIDKKLDEHDGHLRLLAIREERAIAIEQQALELERKALALLAEIHRAVVPEPVAKIIIRSDLKEVATMDMQTGQSSTLTLSFLDANGNPTVPKGVPQWAASDQGTNFTVTVAADGLSAVLAATGAVGSQETIVVSVDGVQSDPFVANIVAPPPQPVAKIVINASTPA